MSEGLRIGVDLGGTKIAASVFAHNREPLLEKRVPTPRGDYNGTVETISALVEEIEEYLQAKATVGVGIPGSISPTTGLVQNANSTWLNGCKLDSDLTRRLGRTIRLANDANCFALSEAIDGAAAGAHSVFGVIIGTGCGGGLVIGRRLVDGPRSTGGEWGHNPLPWLEPDEFPGPQCWCGRKGCLEVWVSGPGFAADHQREAGNSLSPEEIHDRATRGDVQARQSLHRHASRLARGLAGVVNIFDPDVIILGGGLSNLSGLYGALPQLMAPFIFSDNRTVEIRPPKFGDTSGVRGAAWLWDDRQPD